MEQTILRGKAISLNGNLNKIEERAHVTSKGITVLTHGIRVEERNTNSIDKWTKKRDYK